MEKLDFIDSKFRLAILAAKRAKQLVSGAKKRIDRTAENPLTIALEEIYSGKVNFQILENDEISLEEESSKMSASRLLLGNSSASSLIFGDHDDDSDNDSSDNDDYEADDIDDSDDD